MAQETATAPGDFFAGLLQDHARVEAQLVTLMHAADALSKDPRSAASLEVMTRSLDFFTTEGALHESIEEHILFPRIRPLPAFKQILSALEFQHGMNRVATQELSACVGSFAPESGRELRRLAVRFVEMHRGHAVAEERALFPLAASTLSPQVVAEMSRESSKRN